MIEGGFGPPPKKNFDIYKAEIVHFSAHQQQKIVKSAKNTDNHIPVILWRSGDKTPKKTPKVSAP